MHKRKLVQILLPLYDADNHPFNESLYSQVKEELTSEFGGLTSYTRSPAEGLWQKGRVVERDNIVVYEVMSPKLDREYWKTYKKSLEHRFRQDEIIIRASEIQIIT